MFAVILLLFVLGACIGSFLNVVVYRTMYDDSPLRGRSYCDNCGKLVDWKHNIPLLSFFWLRGKCANCKKKISWQYPVVEFLVGALFVWWFIIGSSFFNLAGAFALIQPLVWLGIGLLLFLIFTFDLIYMVIPDFLTSALFILVLAYRLGLVATSQMRGEDLGTSLIAGGVLAIFFYSLYLGTHKKGFGLGDVYLAPSLGLILGYQRLSVAVFAAFVFGSIVGGVLLFLGKKKFGQLIPFGPFLVIGTAFSLIWGQSIWNWYMSMLV